MKPTDMAPKLSCTYTGDQPAAEVWTCSDAMPRMVGIEGPHISTSMIPVYSELILLSTVRYGLHSDQKVGSRKGGARTCTSGSEANAHPSCAAKVDLPTPPLPERTRILRFTCVMRSRTSGNAGSGPLASPDAHTFWLGQPSQAADLPASSDSVPC